MAFYFVSDVHLQLEATRRAEKFARFVDALTAADRLVIGGDLCDYWFSARQQSADPTACRGLSALIEFRRRGGELMMIAGNHDANLSAYFRRWLQTDFVEEPLVVECFDYRVHLVHGHLAGPRSRFKAAIGGELFHAVFSRTPSWIASSLNKMRQRVNEETYVERCQEFLRAYRDYVRQQLSTLDESFTGKPLFVFGHVHEVVDEPVESARLVVLGDWEECPSYLRIDADGAELVVV